MSALTLLFSDHYTQPTYSLGWLQKLLLVLHSPVLDPTDWIKGMHVTKAEPLGPSVPEI